MVATTPLKVAVLVRTFAWCASLPGAPCRWSVRSRTVLCGDAGAWFSPTSIPQPGSHEEHWKISWQCLPSISSDAMPKSFSADRFTPVMRKSGVIQYQSVGKLVEHGLQHAGFLPAQG